MLHSLLPQQRQLREDLVLAREKENFFPTTPLKVEEDFGGWGLCVPRPPCGCEGSWTCRAESARGLLSASGALSMYAETGVGFVGGRPPPVALWALQSLCWWHPCPVL